MSLGNFIGMCAAIVMAGSVLVYLWGDVISGVMFWKIFISAFIVRNAAPWLSKK